MNPMVLEEGEKIIKFLQKEQSVGVLFECDSPKNLSYFFRNVGTKAIKIQNVRYFCGCTSVQYDEQFIKPDSIGKIVITYNPKNRIGTVDERVYIYTTDSDKYPVACLSVRGEVKDGDLWRHLPQKIGHLRLKRKLVVFKVDSLCSLFTERIWCGNSGDVPLKILAKGLPDYVTFKVEPEILQAGEEGDLVITLKTETPPQNDMSDFHFLVEGAGGNPLESIIKVKIDYMVK